ncbi:MAG: hypothetical protein K1X39_05190 [Thermoflexales bacterium]|nr:hypothetical protein [Thermoflexales bacterium]
MTTKTNEMMIGKYPVVGSRDPISIETTSFRFGNPIVVAGLALAAIFAVAILAILL